jgi:isopenicillin-N N-acyltransferase-like protein
MTTQLPLPLIKVEGRPFECGAQYGAAASELIAGNAAAYLERFQRVVDMVPAAVRRAGAVFRERTAEIHPRIAQMLDGVAEGSGVDVDEIYALNARTELLYGTATATECTSIGVLDSHTTSGHTLLAQNWDWHPAQRPYALLLATRDERGFVVLTLAEAGMLAKAGLNSNGVGLCLNMLGCDRDGRPGGVPYHVLLRAVLEAPNLTWAIRAGCQSPRSASVNLMLGCGATHGSPGEVIDFELVPDDVGVIHPVEGVVTHANHLETRLPVHDTVKGLGGSSYFRSARARRLVGRAGDSISEKDLAAVLADHGSFPNSICRHDLDDVNEEDRSESLYSLILDLDERRLSIAAGPPCAADGYAELALGRIFA